MRFLFNICLLLSLPIIAMDNNQERTTTEFTDECFYKGCQGLMLGSVVAASAVSLVGIPVAIATGANIMIAGTILACLTVGCGAFGGSIGSLIAIRHCMKPDTPIRITRQLNNTAENNLPLEAIIIESCDDDDDTSNSDILISNS